MNMVPHWTQANALMRQLFAMVASNKPGGSEVQVGPWQGAVPTGDLEPPQEVTMQGATLVAWNVKGAFN